MPSDEYLEIVKRFQTEAQSRPDLIRIHGSSIEQPTGQIAGLLGDLPGLWPLLGASNEWGHPALIEQLSRLYGLPPQGARPSRLIVTTGSSSAYALVLDSLRRQSSAEEVLVETPGYEPLSLVAQRRGFAVDTFRRRPEQGYAIDLDDLDRKLSPRTAAVVVTNLHNPSGARLDEEQLQRLRQAVERRSPQAKIVVDETFFGFIRRVQPSVASWGEPWIVVDGLTKVYGLGLLRCGWIVAAAETIEAIRPSWRDFENIGSRLTEALAARFLANLGNIDRHWQDQLAANRPLVVEFLEQMQAAGLLDTVIPQHGCICFPRLCRGNVAAFLDRLLQSYGVALAAGAYFGGDNHFRLGFGGPTSQLSEGLERLQSALRD